MPYSPSDNGTLKLLAKLARGKDDRELAVGVAGDMGLLFADRDEELVRQITNALTAANDRLYDTDSSPLDRLVGAHGDEFLAGALWALADASAAYLTTLDRRRAVTAAKPKRERLRTLILTCLTEADRPLRPRDFLRRAAAELNDVRPDDISKALSDLIRIREIVLADDLEEDRRAVAYALTAWSNPESETAQSSAAATRIVQKRASGDGWEVCAPSSKRVSSIHTSKKEATARARQIVRNDGGGSVVVAGKRFSVPAGRTSASVG